MQNSQQRSFGNSNFRSQRRPNFRQPQRDHLINEEIRANTLRLVSSTGEQLGVVDRHKALILAQEQQCDLVLVVPNAQPPVCKIIEYGKFVYEEQKRKKEHDRKQRENRVEVKEFQFRTVIDAHDLSVKAKRMQEFIDNGDKCKVVITFRGRENSDPNKGSALITKLFELLTDAQIENKPELHGNKMIIMIVQAKKK